MSAREIIHGFMRYTGHLSGCALIVRGPACSCGQVEELKLIRHEASRWLADPAVRALGEAPPDESPPSPPLFGFTPNLQR